MSVILLIMINSPKTTTIAASGNTPGSGTRAWTSPCSCTSATISNIQNIFILTYRSTGVTTPDNFWILSKIHGPGTMKKNLTSMAFEFRFRLSREGNNGILSKTKITKKQLQVLATTTKKQTTNNRKKCARCKTTKNCNLLHSFFIRTMLLEAQNRQKLRTN